MLFVHNTMVVNGIHCCFGTHMMKNSSESFYKSSKCLLLCSAEELKSYRFEVTRRWVNDDYLSILNKVMFSGDTDWVADAIVGQYIVLYWSSVTHLYWSGLLIRGSYTGTNGSPDADYRKNRVIQHRSINPHTHTQKHRDTFVPC